MSPAGQLPSKFTPECVTIATQAVDSLFFVICLLSKREKKAMKLGEFLTPLDCGLRMFTWPLQKMLNAAAMVASVKVGAQDRVSNSYHHSAYSHFVHANLTTKGSG